MHGLAIKLYIWAPPAVHETRTDPALAWESAIVRSWLVSGEESHAGIAWSLVFQLFRALFLFLNYS